MIKTDDISRFISRLFMGGFSVNIDREGENHFTRVRVRDLLLKDDETEGLLIDQLNLNLVSLVADGKGIAGELKNSALVVELFSVFFNENHLNKLLRLSAPLLEKQGMHDVRINFKPDIMTVHGTYRKGIPFSFSIDLKLRAQNGKLIIEADRFWAADAIPLPYFLESAIMNYVQKNMESRNQLIKGVNIHDRIITVDLKALAPMETYLELNNVYLDDKILVLQGSADMLHALEEIERRRLQRKQQKKLELELEINPQVDNIERIVIKEKPTTITGEVRIDEETGSVVEETSEYTPLHEVELVEKKQTNESEARAENKPVEKQIPVIHREKK